MFNPHPRALIVEGGAMRGIFASGVLDAFVESHHYPFDFVMGVSAGATNLVSYLSEQPRRSHHIITELACSSDFLDPLRFVKGGDLVDVRWLWRTSRYRFPLDLDTFSTCRIPFYAVITEVATGAAVYLPVRPENMDEVLTATCALPVVQHETPCVEGRPMADGGISDSIPVIEAYRRGARRMTVVLSEPRGYRKKPARFCWMVKALRLQPSPRLYRDAACRLRDRGDRATGRFSGLPLYPRHVQAGVRLFAGLLAGAPEPAAVGRRCDGRCLRVMGHLDELGGDPI